MSVYKVAMVVIFTIGLILTISERYHFERNKKEYDKKYISLFRRHNVTMLLLYIALLIYAVEEILNKMNI